MGLPRWTVLLAIAGVLCLASCGSNKAGSSGTSSSATAATLAKKSVEAPPTVPPTQIPITQPLAKAPPSGKKAIFLQCEVPVCQRFVNGFRAATAAIGWSSEILPFKNANPGATLEQAISQKPDYIAMTGIPAAAIRPQLAEAKKAGIPIISCSTTENDFVNSAFAMQCGGTLATDAAYIGRWMVNDSSGKVHAVSVNVPQFPILNTISDYFKANLPKLCSGCTWGELPITLDTLLAGQTPAKVIAYLQTHPDTNYVIFNLVDPFTGFAPVLKSAGFADKVKVVAITDNKTIVEGVVQGTVKAATLAANEYLSWVMVDGMARLSTGEQLTPEYRKSIYDSPTWVLDDPKVAQGLLDNSNGSWTGPAGYKEQFKKLWHVG